MKNILFVVLILVLSISSFAQAKEPDTQSLIWQEIKNSKDISDFKYYLQKYPNGTYSYFAKKNIKILTNNNIDDKTTLNKKPNWVDSKDIPYRYYGIGYASKHFRGKQYTINLATNRAKENLLLSFKKNQNLTEDMKIKYMNYTKKKIYSVKNNIRTYVMIYIDNYEL